MEKIARENLAAIGEEFVIHAVCEDDVARAEELLETARYARTSECFICDQRLIDDDVRATRRLTMSAAALLLILSDPVFAARR